MFEIRVQMYGKMCNVTVDIAPIIWQIAPNLILDKDDEYTSKRFLFFQDPDGLPIKMYEHQIPIYLSIGVYSILNIMI